jgi:DNA-binding PadR family transcriptional regulator
VDDGVGHAHKYYRLAGRGRQVLDGMRASWREHVLAMQKLIGDP